MGRRRHNLFATRRRRRSTRGDVAAGLIIVGVVAVATLGVYLLIIAAIALLGWLVAVVAERGFTFCK